MTIKMSQFIGLAVTILSGALTTVALAQNGQLESDIPQWGYYTVRRDFRKCISPICGGFFIQQLNRKVTPCFDGIFRDECYVSAIDFTALGLSDDELAKLQSEDSSRLILQGPVDPVEFPGLGEFGELLAKEAFLAATDKPPRGSFVLLKDNGIRCVTTPCFSTDRRVLNKPTVTTVSSLDFRRTNATNQQLQAATAEIQGMGLVAVGETRKIDTSRSTDVTFSASQFYLRVR